MKFALVCFGNEESYGMIFVGSELEEYQQEIKYFDAERDKEIVERILEWGPKYVAFSPMTTFFQQASTIAIKIKSIQPSIVTVFGGHHATAAPEIINLDFVDIVVRGPVRGSIDRILRGYRGVILTQPTTPDDLPFPDRHKYYYDIPRMALRYRKVMLSMLGCPFNCSYCSSSALHRRKLFGLNVQREYFTGRRSIKTIIEEAKQIIEYPTKEIEWVDDDIFTASKQHEDWLSDFIQAWYDEINLPMYISTTSLNALLVSDKILTKINKIVNCIGMGIQAIRPDSLELFNRGWDSEKKMKEAYDRLISFGFNVNLQAIVGLPVEDSIEDAIDTVEGLKRIGDGSIVSIYPLQVYPHTRIEEIVKERGFKINDDCVGDTNTGIGGINFSYTDQLKLRNICKFGTLYVRGNIDKWWRAALEVGKLNHLLTEIDESWFYRAIQTEFDDHTSLLLSRARYHDCVIDRLGSDIGEKVFIDIMASTNIRS